MRKRGIAIISMLLMLSGCGNQPKADVTETDMRIIVPASIVTTNPTAIAEISYIERTPKWTSDELQAMALTLAGECYDDKEQDKWLVCEVILNRVSDGRFGDSIQGVLTAEGQFTGYWKQARPVTDNDLQIAEQVLEAWFENDCKALSEYLFFCAGNNRENYFY